METVSRKTAEALIATAERDKERSIGLGISVQEQKYSWRFIKQVKRQDDWVPPMRAASRNLKFDESCSSIHQTFNFVPYRTGQIEISDLFQQFIDLWNSTAEKKGGGFS